MTTPAQSLLPNQFTVRLGDSELEYVNENLHLIRGEDVEMPRSKIFVTAVTKAIQNQPKEKTVDNPEHLTKIEAQVKEINELNDMVQSLQAEREQLELNQNELPTGAIVLNLSPKFRKYFWAVLEISKKQEYAATYEELLEKMFEIFNARNEFKFDQTDVEYLNTLTYDGPAEN